MAAAIRRLLPPPSIKIIFNGDVIQSRKVLSTISACLLTEIEDTQGHLRSSSRLTTIEVYETAPGEVSMIYEMGIPICDTGDKWHYNIMQKVPLGTDRTNVRPSYLRDVRIAVFNQLYEQIDDQDVNSDWVTVAVNSPFCRREAFEHWKNLKFGEKAVAFDPSDLEANKRAVASGYTIVSGRMIGSGAWENSRAFKTIPSAGQVTPSAKVWSGQNNPEATIFRDWIPEEKRTTGMRQIANYARMIARHIIGRDIIVRFCSTAQHLAGASYGSGELTFNKFRLGKDWFEHGITLDVDSTLIHELAHNKVSDHLSSEFHEELSMLAAKIKRLSLEHPELFSPYTRGCEDNQGSKDL